MNAHDSKKLNLAPPACPTTGTACSLDCLPKGTKGRVASVAGPNRCRLMELGFTSGTEVEVSRRAAFGGPLEVRLRSYRLSLRCEEAAGISVEPAS
ncbi:MAG: ferrous iron transport protein A [Akkermansiaceae bacterium]|nr:ferrous iron transport protein A [Armatimonadota bacterium]